MKSKLEIPLLLLSWLALIAALAFLLGVLGPMKLSAQGPPQSPNDFRKRELERDERRPLPPVPKPGEVQMGIRSIELPDEFRSIDGEGNNLDEPLWGSAEVPLIRLLPNAYEDGASEPAGEDRPNPREISNRVHAQRELRPNRRGASDMLWQWGQFLDHDLDLTPVMEPVEPLDIAVPAGDPFFDPHGTGQIVIGFERSFHVSIDGVRQQFNEITAYIDASSVYGSDEERALGLRTLDETGRLLTSEGNLLPFNTEGLPNAPSALDPRFFLAGDFRANEQVGLTAMHTLFVREHNYWADVIAKANPDLTGDQIYESARVIVAAEIQSITYNEFLPVLLGEGTLPRYNGYWPGLEAGISNEFATAAYRLGHSMLSTSLLRLDERGREHEAGHLSLSQAFFQPSRLVEEGGIDPILRGLAWQRCQEIDPWIIDDVRNFLFGPPGAGGFDLASLNIQRGRDHGLPSYNEAREALGLRPARRFSDITRDRRLEAQLERVYEEVDRVDLWVGGLAEDHVRGAMVGETFLTLLREQFVRLRDGDRFFYKHYLSPELQRLIEMQTLAVIIRRNTEIGRELQDQVFLVKRGTGVLDEEEPTPSSQVGPQGTRGRRR